MDLTNLHALSASDAARLIRDGVISSAQLVDACLARIEAVDPEVQAWAFLDPDLARAQATAADEYRLSGRPLGPLHGVPVGVKDIIDTADMPTENGSVLHAGRTPARDATVVSMLRAAGAVIMGKTVTTEFAAYAPGKTRNPHNAAHTPGGSSSGSAASVAAGMVPVAIGSQTNGSVIRPAAFCGVYGFKPTHGLIPRPGVLPLCRSLDTLGVFARTRRGRRSRRRAAGRIRRARSRLPAPGPHPLPRRGGRGAADHAAPRLRQDLALGPDAPRDARGVRGAEGGPRRRRRGRAHPVCRGARVASPDHGSRDGGEPRPRVDDGAGPPVRCPPDPARARARGHGRGLPAGAPSGGGVRRRAGRALPGALRRDPHPVRAGQPLRSVSSPPAIRASARCGPSPGCPRSRCRS